MSAVILGTKNLKIEKMVNSFIEQNKYGTLDISEDKISDIIEISQSQKNGKKGSFNLIQVERENIEWLIGELQMYACKHTEISRDGKECLDCYKEVKK